MNVEELIKFDREMQVVNGQLKAQKLAIIRIGIDGAIVLRA